MRWRPMEGPQLEGTLIHQTNLCSIYIQSRVPRFFLVQREVIYQIMPNAKWAKIN
jgi:hypothetical protein